MKYSQGKILVTGGAGFIGSHLTEKLIANDEDVSVLDNLSTGKKSNLTSCIDKKNFRLIIEDLKNQKQIQTYIKDIDTVFHMAADPEVRTGFSEPELAYEQNIQNTFNLLENIRKSNVKQIVFASSSVVYGEPKIIPTPESYGPLIPISIYGGTKLACEGLISSYCRNYGIKGTIVRFANVVGSRSRHGVTWDFIQKLKKNNKELKILGDGKQTKSYIHVSDCINGILFCLEKTKQFEIFNLGNFDAINVIDIASIIFKTMKLDNVRISNSGGTEDGRGWIGDVKEMNLDIKKITDLGWKPKKNSIDSIEKTTEEIIQKDFKKINGL